MVDDTQTEQSAPLIIEHERSPTFKIIDPDSFLRRFEKLRAKDVRLCLTFVNEDVRTVRFRSDDRSGLENRLTNVEEVEVRLTRSLNFGDSALDFDRAPRRLEAPPDACLLADEEPPSTAVLRAVKPPHQFFSSPRSRSLTASSGFGCGWAGSAGAVPG